jgi:hypothetical protein
MTLGDWARADRNLAIFGATQQGKTVGANQIQAEDDRLGVLLAPDPETWMTGVRVSDRSDLAAVLRSGRRSCVVPAGLWADLEEHHGRWTRWLLATADRVDGLAVTLVHDEAQDLDADALTTCLKRGLKRGVRNVVVTQSPASRSVPLEALRQCGYYCWVGPIGSFDRNYINDHGIFDPAEIDNDDHEYTTVTRTGEVVARGRFDARRYGGV